MARPQRVTDDQIRACVGLNMTPPQIAKHCGISETQAYRRVKRLQSGPAVMMAPEVVEATATSLWDVQRSMEEVYGRLCALLPQCDTVPQSVMVLRAMREVIADARETLEAVYSVQGIQDLQDALFEVLDACDPTLQRRVVEGLRQRQSLRAAALCVGAAVSRASGAA